MKRSGRLASAAATASRSGVTSARPMIELRGITATRLAGTP